MQAEEKFGISVIGIMVVSKGSDFQERRSLETNKQNKTGKQNREKASPATKI